jgi:Na+/H+ antiporter NhaC
MSSAGAQCNHINHVSTQMPYALTCAAVSAVTYIIAGLIRNAAISLLVGFVIMLAVMFIFKIAGGKAAPASTAQNNN